MRRFRAYRIELSFFACIGFLGSIQSVDVGCSSVETLNLKPWVI